MREKGQGAHASAASPLKPASKENRRRIRADLERWGVPPEFSRSISIRLGAISDGLTPDVYEAVLASVAIAHRTHGERLEVAAAREGDLSEIKRLMNGFVNELKKLDEALQILSAYVGRMRKSAITGHTGKLH